MPTINDVAQRAGVTPATVSYVITGRGSVGKKTRERVLEAIQELGYRPNLLARGLRQSKTYTLALLVPTIANPFYPEIAEEVERIARQRGYSLMLCNTHYDVDLSRTHLQKLASHSIDGVIAVGGFIDKQDLLAMTQQGTPIVLCNWCEIEKIEDFPSIEVDYHCAGELAAQHLLQLGHRSFAVIAQLPAHRMRVDGFRETLRRAGVILAENAIYQGDSTFESGMQAAQQLLSHPDVPTAVFTTNDSMALGFLETAKSLNFRIPTDLSVVGLDDIMPSSHACPPLTTVAMPKRALAVEATHLLFDALENKNAVSPAVVLQPNLIIRQSTTSPRN